MDPRILLIEADAATRHRMAGSLQLLPAVDLLVASDAGAARALLAHSAMALLVIDADLPDDDGLALCRELAHDPAGRHGHRLLVSAQDRAPALAAAYTAGADDFMAKPCDQLELQLRARALLRSAARGRIAAAPQERLRFHLAQGVVIVDGAHVVALTRTELLLLQALAARPGEVVPATELAGTLRGGGTAALQAHVHHLRKKLVDTPARIVTGRWGYQLILAPA